MVVVSCFMPLLYHYYACISTGRYHEDPFSHSHKGHVDVLFLNGQSSSLTVQDSSMGRVLHSFRVTGFLIAVSTCCILSENFQGTPVTTADTPKICRQEVPRMRPATQRKSLRLAHEMGFVL